MIFIKYKSYIMKHKVFIQILLLIVFFSNIHLSFSQISTDYMEYWYYRNRLKYFVIPGIKIGDSQVAAVRNRLDNDANYRKANVDYGQDGDHDGLYIGVLATEYYLLNANGQTTDATNTLNELYYALHTVNIYWDSLAETYWPGGSGSINGFFIRGNVPTGLFSDTLISSGVGFAANGKTNLSLLNKGLKTSDIWNGNTFGSFPLGHPGYADHATCYNSLSNVQSMSQDEAVGILIGCALASKLSTGAAQTLAKNMAFNIANYLINKNQIYGSNYYRIYNPDGRKVFIKDGGDTYAWGPGYIKVGSEISGSSISAPFSIWKDIIRQTIAWHFEEQTGLGDNYLVAFLIAMGNTLGTCSSQGIYNLTNGNNWDTFDILLWEVLNNKKRTHHNQTNLLNKSLGQLNSAPCEGPYCYLPDNRNYFFYGSKHHRVLTSYCNNGVYAGGGWATSYRWYNDKGDQDHGKTNFWGNFSGCDYMLLYNLYQIVTMSTAPFYVDYIDRDLVGTVNTPYNFVGYSTIYSTQIIDPTTRTVNYIAGDSIKLISGFHAVHGSNFHAFIGSIDCGGSSFYPDSMYTNYYDSLISMRNTYTLTADDDTIINNNINYTLGCPLAGDSLSFANIFCDTIDTVYAYHWDFGNGQTSNLQNPTIYYSTSGTYNISVTLTDTNRNVILPDSNTSLVDTFYVSITVPVCELYGYLFENPSCGGACIAGDSLCIADSSGAIISAVSPAYTQMDGSFTFNSAQINLLDTNKTYTIISKNGISLIQPPGAQKISQWIKQSPVTLYYATTVHQEWERRYNGTQDTTDYATALDLQGNIYVTGATDSSTSYSPGYDWLTIKYDPSGTKQWAETYSGDRHSNLANIARAITADASGNVYITGESYPHDSPILTTLSYTTSGTLQWVQTYQPSTYTTTASTKCILQDHAGNIVVGATSINQNDRSRIYTVVKYTTAGDSLWSRHYIAAPSNSYITALAVDTGNNIYATGYSMNSSNDFVTIKFNSSGVQQWIKTYDNSGYNDTAYSNTIDNNGNIIVAGFSQVASGNDAISVISYNAAGAQNWVKTYSNDAHDYAYKVLCDNANNVYVCGYYSNSTGTSGLLALKYNSSGNLLWSKHSLSTNIFVFKSAAMDVAGDLYITGTTKNGYTDIITQKLDGSDSIQWTIQYNGPAGHNRNNIPGQIMVSANGNVYVCGASDSTGTGYDFTTIKYSQCLSTAPLLKISTTNTNTPANGLDTSKVNSFVQVIPNPNNGNMHVVYKNPGNTTGTFNVYNIMGKQVLSYPLYPGVNTLIISRTDLDPGIYLYRAIAGNKLIGKDKIVIIQ